MPIQQDVIERPLIAKEFLNRIRFVPTVRPDRIALARHILACHDAADLAIAGIARHLDKLPEGAQVYFMDYFPKIKESHPTDEVPGREYFAQLNRVRTKTRGLPSMNSWRCN